MNDDTTNDDTSDTPAPRLATGDMWYRTDPEQPHTVVIGGVFETEDDEYVTVDTNPYGATSWLTLDTATFRETYRATPPMTDGILYYSPEKNAYFVCRGTTAFKLDRGTLISILRQSIPKDITQAVTYGASNIGRPRHLTLPIPAELPH
jgi:hypothetical protein